MIHVVTTSGTWAHHLPMWYTVTWIDMPPYCLDLEGRYIYQGNPHISYPHPENLHEDAQHLLVAPQASGLRPRALYLSFSHTRAISSQRG